MKKTKIWMLITGCLNLIEVILNTDVLLNRNGCLAKMVSDLADSKIWVDIEFVHHLIALFLLTAVGQWCSIRVLRKYSHKDWYWYAAIVVLVLILTRIIVHNLAMKQYVWIPGGLLM